MRKEERFLISNEEALNLKKTLAKIAHLDSYCEENGFYDVVTYYILRWKSGDSKGKIRLKKYERGHIIDYFIENKYKNKEYGYKIRMKIDSTEAEYILNSSSQLELLKLINNISSELLFFMRFEDVKIKNIFVSVSYKRTAYYFDYQNNSYRVTIDEKIYKEFEQNNYPAFEKDACIVEIKAEKEIDEVLKLLNFKPEQKKNNFSKFKLTQSK